MAVGLTIALWGLGTVSLGGSVVANNWGGNIDHDCDETIYAQCVAKRADMRFWFNSNLRWKKKDAHRSAATSEYNNHGSNNGEVQLTETSTQSESHIHIRQSDAGLNGAWAWGYCPSTSSSGSYGSNKKWCEPQNIVWNEQYSGNFDTDAKKRAIACHEFGHVYGLRHRSSDCMKNPPSDSDQDLGGHDMNCITTYYPTSTNGLLISTEPPYGQDCS